MAEQVYEMLLVDAGVGSIGGSAGVVYLPDVQMSLEDLDEGLFEISDGVHRDVDAGIGPSGIVDVECVDYLGGSFLCVNDHFCHDFRDVVIGEGGEGVAVVEYGSQLRVLVDVGEDLGVDWGGSSC